MVVIAPLTEDTGSTQERTGSPSTCTVQAPHCATPQPYLVPVSPTCSRIAHNKGVLGSTSNVWGFPLMVRRAIVLPPFLGRLPGAGAVWRGFYARKQLAQRLEELPDL